MYTFYDNQIKTANKLIRRIKKHSYVMLVGQMQCGKTGVYLNTALRCIKTGVFDKVIIICGSRDTSLRTQLKKDIEEAIKSYHTKQTGDTSILDIKKSDKAKDCITLSWSQDLKNLPPISDNTLVIHDESHFAQSKDNKPYTDFYKRNNLEKSLYGDMTELIARNIKIISVSATPFSELVANSSLIENGEIKKKEVLFIEPPEDYRGVPYLLKNNKIKFDSQRIDSEKADIYNVIREGKYHNKYIIVRTHLAKRHEALMRNIAYSCNCDYKQVFSVDKDTDPYDFLDIEPFMNTVVHICGKARMGQVLYKQHVGMVYEQSSNPNIDTTLQGLLGRMCGMYDTEAPDIYVSYKIKQQIIQWVMAIEKKDYTLLQNIRKATNVTSTGITFKSNFAKSLSSEQEPVFSNKSSSNILAFRRELKKHIFRTQKGHKLYNPNCANSVSYMNDFKDNVQPYLLFDKEHYTIEQIQEELKAIEQKCGVTLYLTEARGRPPILYHKFASISWC